MGAALLAGSAAFPWAIPHPAVSIVFMFLYGGALGALYTLSPRDPRPSVPGRGPERRVRHARGHVLRRLVHLAVGRRRRHGPVRRGCDARLPRRRLRPVPRSRDRGVASPSRTKDTRPEPAPASPPDTLDGCGNRTRLATGVRPARSKAKVRPERRLADPPNARTELDRLHWPGPWRTARGRSGPWMARTTVRNGRSC